MKKTSELTGAALDWAVAKCEGEASFGWTTEGTKRTALLCIDETWRKFNPSTDWAQGGPIIERWEIDLSMPGIRTWKAKTVSIGRMYVGLGPTPLIAAMRCYVASKLGDTVELPQGLI